MSTLIGKVCLITGASSGIGAATAIHFSKLGARLAICGRNSVNLEQVSKECARVNANSAKPLIIVADVSNERDVERLKDSILQEYGKLDVLINNAGRRNTLLSTYHLLTLFC